MSHLPDETTERNHVFRRRSSKSPTGNYVFKGKSFTVPDMDYDETPLMYFKMFLNDKLIELISEQTNKSLRRKLNNLSIFKCTSIF